MGARQKNERENNKRSRGTYGAGLIGGILLITTGAGALADEGTPPSLPAALHEQ